MPCVQVRILKKKMQQIEALEARAAPLDPQQRSKVSAKPLLESALALLEAGAPLGEVQALLAAAKGGMNITQLGQFWVQWDWPAVLYVSAGRDVHNTTFDPQGQIDGRSLGCEQLFAGVS